MIQILIVSMLTILFSTNAFAQDGDRERRSWSRLVDDCRTVVTSLRGIGLVVNTEIAGLIPTHEKALTELEKAVKSSNRVAIRNGLLRVLELELITEITLVAIKPCSLLGGNLAIQTSNLLLQKQITAVEDHEVTTRVIEPADRVVPDLQGVLRRIRSATIVEEATKLLAKLPAD